MENITNSNDILSSIEELRKNILLHITSEQMDHDNISDLMVLHKMGLTVLDTESMDPIITIYDSTTYVSRRAYYNCLMERNQVCRLATALYHINDNIAISETVLHKDPKDDHLNLYSFTRDSIPLSKGLYPMVCLSKDESTQWLSSCSGNVLVPMKRSYITDRFDLSPELTEDIFGKYSLVQIWSQNLYDTLFKDIVQAIRKIT